MNIAIVDSSTYIESFVKNYNNFSEIITLDYDSDRELSSKNIFHKTSDDLLSEAEMAFIDALKSPPLSREIFFKTISSHSIFSF